MTSNKMRYKLASFHHNNMKDNDIFLHLSMCSFEDAVLETGKEFAITGLEKGVVHSYVVWDARSLVSIALVFFKMSSVKCDASLALTFSLKNAALCKGVALSCAWAVLLELHLDTIRHSYNTTDLWTSTQYQKIDYEQ